MTRLVTIHPDNPQARKLDGVAACLREGGLIAYPTDSSYAFGCQLGNAQALERIRRIRQTDKHHNFTLVCPDLAAISTYARVDNQVFRTLKSFTPGPYTFILRATAEVPRKMQHPKRRTIGIRIPDHNVALGIVSALGEPIVSSTLLLPDFDYLLTDPREILDVIGRQLDLIVDCGFAGMEPTSVVDLSGDSPEVVREGLGDVTVFK